MEKVSKKKQICTELLNNINCFVVEAEEEFNGHFFQWRKYTNLPAVKSMGGIYASWCDNGNIRFYRSAYIRDRSFPRFVDENSEVK